MKTIFICVCFFLYFLNFSSALNVQVEPKSQECFYFDITEAGTKVSIPFYITRGGLLDIDLRLTGSNGEYIHSGMRFESGNADFVANSVGVHALCFNNEMARWTAKVVNFHILIGDQANIEPIKKGQLNPMEDSVNKISASLDSAQKDQRFLRVREQRHRDTADSTNERVLWYSLLESVVLISIALGQVYYLRKFFEVKRNI